MIILGLTGSIGMGKTTTARIFAKAGIPVFDADATVHRLYQKDAAVIARVKKRFPEAVMGEKIDRARLGELVRAKSGALGDLEKIIHPAVLLARNRWLENAKEAGASIVLFDIPLLFETGGEKTVDKTIVVSASALIQRQRVLSRSGMTEARFTHLLSRQMPDEQKRARADFVIDTSKSLEDAARQVQSIVNQLDDK